MRRFQPLNIATHTLKNRLVVPPMASQTATTDGLTTDATTEHYRNLSRSGAGLVMVEYRFVHTTGKSEPNQLGAHNDECIEGMTKIADAIHSNGAKAGFQLTHCGGKAQLDICPDLMGPSGITVPAYDRTLPQPKAMSVDDIELWIESFVQAAIRVEKAGWEILQSDAAREKLRFRASETSNCRSRKSTSTPLGFVFVICARRYYPAPRLNIGNDLCQRIHSKGDLFGSEHENHRNAGSWRTRSPEGR